MNEINVGDRVRSFDFARPGTDLGRDLEGERASYVEGEVVAIEKAPGGYNVYKILVDNAVFGGEPLERLIGTHVYPPVNGTRTWGSPNLTDGVELLENANA